MGTTRTVVKIIEDPNNRKALAYARKLKKALERRDVWLTLSDNEATLFVVLGGDGTMLLAKEGRHSGGKIFLGINFGDKGFMMNDRISAEEAAERISQNHFKLCCVPLLEVKAGESEVKLALNDAYVKSIGAKSARIALRVNGTTVAEGIKGDGIVVSTALGSTGYALAAGGAAVYCGLQAISIVPIAVHTPIQIKPMVFHASANVEIEILNHSFGETKGFYDGMELPSAQKIYIGSGMKWFLLAFWPEADFTERLVRKIMRAGRG